MSDFISDMKEYERALYRELRGAGYAQGLVDCMRAVRTSGSLLEAIDKIAELGKEEHEPK